MAMLPMAMPAAHAYAMMPLYTNTVDRFTLDYAAMPRLR